MPYLKGFLFPVQKLSRLEHILGVLGCFCTNARSDTLTADTVAVWKHRGTPLLHVSSTKEWWGCTRAVVVTNITAWGSTLLSCSHLLQDFLGSLPSCMKDIVALSPSIIKNKKSQSPICTLKRNSSSVTVPLWLLPALPRMPLVLFSP